MHRRKFIVVALAALGASRIAVAQQRAKLPRVVLLTSAPLPNPLAEAFRRGMRELGYVEGQSVELDLRSADGRPERFPALAADVVKSNPDVIVSGGGTPSARAAMKATKTIPIVFPASGDPVAEGLVQSLARPGGNATGFSILAPEVSGKRVQLIKELLPRVKRIAILQDPVLRAGYDQIGATEEAARALCGQNPEGGETGRSAGRAGIEIRAGRESQNCQSAKCGDSAGGLGPRRPHHPIARLIRNQARHHLPAVAPIDPEIGIGGQKQRIRKRLGHAYQARVRQAHGHAGVLLDELEHRVELAIEVERQPKRTPPQKRPQCWSAARP